MSRTRLLGPLAALASLFVSAPALAGSATSDMSVSATISANCTISAGALSFGAYDPVSANAASPLDASATLTVNCTSGASATIDLNQGANPDAASTATVPERRLASGSDRLAYYLYQDSGHTTVWGSGAATKSYTGTGSGESVTVYGRITAGQNLPAGSYSDTVTATINF